MPESFDTTAMSAPRLGDVPEPQVVALVQASRAGSKLFQSFLDGHDSILMVPGYPLMYLNAHWDLWRSTHGASFHWAQAIDLFCEKHGSVIDSRRVAGLSGLDRLGDNQEEHIAIDEARFRRCLAELLDGEPISRRSFFLAVHYAYGLCKGWNLRRRPVLVFHAHHPWFLPAVAADFPDLKVICTMRHPVGAVASIARGLGFVDREKLNATDAIVWSGRTFLSACQLEFDMLHAMADQVDPARIVAVRLEDVHEDLARTMRHVAEWVEIPFKPLLLDSTFDGKAWWGDVTNETPVNGPDPEATTDKWRHNLGAKDQFVVEGIRTDFYDLYAYRRECYRFDGWAQRLRLALSIALPMRAEWQRLGFLLAPGTHCRMVHAAAAEARGDLPRKNYTWNGTYLFKWTYLDLKLWRPRLQDRIFGRFGGALERSAPPLSAWRRALYVAFQYLRLWAAIVCYPALVVRRAALQYRQMSRRLRGTKFLPPPIARALTARKAAQETSCAVR
jgi:hypothetical protein